MQRHRNPNAYNDGDPVFLSTTCPHLLPLLGGQVIGATKINPDLGQVVSDPHNPEKKFIR